MMNNSEITAAIKNLIEIMEKIMLHPITVYLHLQYYLMI